MMQMIQVKLGHGIIREAREDGRLVLYSTDEPTREAIDTWFEDVVSTMRSWPRGQSNGMLYDFSSPKASLTPYARARVGELLEHIPPENKNFAAIILARSLTGQAIQLFLRAAGQPQNAEVRVFFSRQEGLNWLVRNLLEQS